MKIIRALILLPGLAGMAFSASIPADRLPPAGYWNPGCIGTNGQTYRQSGKFVPPVNLTNIINVRNAPFNAVGDGVHDDTTNLQFAISRGDNSVIYLPKGTYKITGSLELANPNWPWVWASKILRGDGMTNTVIRAFGSSGPFISATTSNPNEPRQLAQTTLRGANTIKVSSWSSYYDTQNWGILYVPNAIAGAPWSAGQAYEESAKSQMVHIIARDPATRTITFDPPAYFDWDTNTTFAIFYGSDSSVGVENLGIENVSGAVTHNINFSGVFNSWIRGVESKYARKWHIRLNNCARCDILDSYIHGYFYSSGVGGGDSVYGTGIYGKSSDNLIMNNRFDRCRHTMIVEYGDIGNVFAYNYSQNGINEGLETTDFLMEDMSQHGLTAFNLWEGNVAQKFSADNSLGGSVYNMCFRNNLTRMSIPTVLYAKWGYDVQVSNYWVSVIGCVMNNAGYNPTWRVGAPNGNGDYRGVGFTDPTGTPADPTPTLYVHGTVDLQSNVVTWASSNSDHAQPASLFLTNRPAFWASGTPWPAIGPDVAGNTNIIPAQILNNFLSGIFSKAATDAATTDLLVPPTELKVDRLNL